MQISAASAYSGTETLEQALEVEEQVRQAVDPAGPGPGEVRLVAGMDVAYDKHSDRAVGAVVLMDATSSGVVDQAVAEGVARFPYVPGLFAFREVPVLWEAWTRLSTQRLPDLLLCDGQGVAHPRRCGLACHLGVLTGVPTVGVAKTRFIGSYPRLSSRRGDCVPLSDGGEVVGGALRTQDGVKEIFVSVGHRIDLAAACAHVLRLAPRYRLPEVIREADSLGRRVMQGRQ